MMKQILKVFLIILVTSQSSSDQKTEDQLHHLQKRGLFYPWLLFSLNAATGILVAIAIPIHDLEDRNVFVSYNFEANYNMPNVPRDSVPGPPFYRWKLGSTYEDMSPKPDATIDDIVARGFDGKNLTIVENVKKVENETKIENVTTHNLNERSIFDKLMFTRKGVYRSIESRLNANYLDGKKCLLRAICESAESPLIHANGVLGHVLHIILTPSSSMDENLPLEYLKAEKLGQENKCQKYIKRCGVSILDSISSFIGF